MICIDADSNKAVTELGYHKKNFGLFILSSCRPLDEDTQSSIIGLVKFVHAIHGRIMTHQRVNQIKTFSGLRDNSTCLIGRVN